MNRRRSTPAFDPDVHPLAAKWAARMDTPDREVARRIGIPTSLLRQWIAEHPAFPAAITQGREVVDPKVMQALYERAIGCETETSEIVVEGEKRRIKKVRRQIPPDTRAAIFYLKNRRADEWRDKPAVKESEETIIRVYPIKCKVRNAEGKST